jgi:hypothetical protein
MLVRYNGEVIAKKDQRFKDDFWTDGKKDPRIRKRKKIRKINLSSMAKRGLSLILVLGFVGLHTAGFNQNGTTTPAEAENASDGVVEPPEWIKDKYPDNQINEFDGGETGDLFDKYFGKLADEARLVASCESGMNPKAHNKKTDDRGMLQINYPTWHKVFGDVDYFDEETNIRLAKQIYDSSGNWSPWKSSKKCHCLN